MVATADSRFLSITSNKGLKGTFSTFGAGVRSLTLNGKPLILELADPNEYLLANQFFGKTLGRVAGRIPDKFTIGDHTYSVLGDKDHICLHGGIMESLSFRNFEGTLITSPEGNSIQFTYLSKDLECGFPGNLEVKVTYFIPNDRNELTIRFEAKADKSTPVSLSNHIYWNIFNSDNVNNYRYYVNASKYGVFKKGTQLIVKTANVPACLDFRKKPLLKTNLDLIEKEIPEIGTLDHAFLLDEVTSTKPQAILDTEHLTIECYTDYDCINNYVDSSLSKINFTNGKGLTTARRRAIAIEPEMYPLDDLVLKGGNTYSHFMTYKLISK
jgi:aldose 1-epimerase